MSTFALGDKASLSELRTLVRRELRAVDAEPRAAFDCLQALTKTCRRALSHDKNPGRLEVSWEVDAKRAIFEIRLTGAETKEDPALTGAADALMDAVQTKSKRGVMTISMRKNLH